MWNFICEQNLNLVLLGIAILAVSYPIAYGIGWVLIRFVNGVMWWAHDHITGVCTLPRHETGVGEIEPIEATAERREWEELMNVFDFGRQS